MNKMLQFFSENKDALTSIGILLTFLISSISLYFSVRNNKAVHYGILACLKGLKEQGCNGPVTEAIDKIQKHINKQAHDQED